MLGSKSGGEPFQIPRTTDCTWKVKETDFCRNCRLSDPKNERLEGEGAITSCKRSTNKDGNTSYPVQLN